MSFYLSSYLYTLCTVKGFCGYSQGKSNLKLNSSACQKYEYGHLDRW